MKLKNVLPKLILLSIFAVFVTACSSDDDYDSNEPIYNDGDGYGDGGDGDGVSPTEKSKTYSLGSVGDVSISGTATFIEMSDNSITVELELDGTPDGGEHPAHIHVNSMAETGDVARTLASVDGSTGKSSTNFTSLDDGSSISYDDLLDYDGHMNIHLSSDDLTVVAQGDIGGNELTGTTKTYTLDEADVSGISGTAEFAERANGTALLTVTLEGTDAGDVHPSHIHANDVAAGGESIVDLTAVDGGTGIAKTHIAEFNDGNSLTYEDILTLDAHINVHLSGTEMSTYIAEGNIGSNEGQTQTVNYDVTNNGSSVYIFNGNELTNKSNPDLTLERGKTYTFTVDAPGHPFYINTVNATGSDNAYTSGVTNNGVSSGTITFTVPTDAPDTLYYNCEFHSAMNGTINIID